MPKISVIVPVYKVEQYLHQCVDSILDQTFTDFELILVDDGSPDNCGAICDEYASKDNRITVIHKENGGLSDARNAGLDIAKGEYIFFCDSDDQIHISTLQLLYNAIIEHNVSIAISNILEERKIPESYSLPKTNCVFEHITINEENIFPLYENPYFCWVACGKLVKSEILKKNKFPFGRYYEDNPTVPRWLYDAKSIVVTNTNLYFYRINEIGISKSPVTVKHLEDRLWSNNEIYNFWKNKNYRKMIDKFAHILVQEFFLCYKEAKRIEQKYSNKIKRQAREWWNKNKNETEFSKREKIKIKIVTYSLFYCLYIMYTFSKSKFDSLKRKFK